MRSDATRGRPVTGPAAGESRGPARVHAGCVTRPVSRTSRCGLPRPATHPLGPQLVNITAEPGFTSADVTRPTNRPPR